MSSKATIVAIAINDFLLIVLISENLFLSNGQQDCTFHYGVSCADRDGTYDAILLGSDFVFHFHCLKYQENLSVFDLVAYCNFNVIDDAG